MLFNSLHFLYFFPFVVVLFYLFPKKYRYIWLLGCSYYFYMCWNAKYAILLFGSTLITYIGSLIVDKLPNRKLILTSVIVLNLGILGFFKYTNFFVEIVELAMKTIGIQISAPEFDIILPVGISFYIFQALSYMIDVYKGKVRAEKNFLKYALFVSFFPQLVAGPIERTGHLLPQLQRLEHIKPEYDRIVKGLILMLYGFFVKIVVADRIAHFVDYVYSFYNEGGRIELGLAALLFPIEIYCDFYGYSTIAIGAALVMGIELCDNFRQPYFATSIKEHWRRWHISLSNWFRDYVYIPLGGNRCSRARQDLNILVTFLLSGLWHGAGFHYLVWGGIHGLYQIVEGRLGGHKIDAEQKGIVKVAKILWTYFLIAIAFIFFRSDSVGNAIHYLQRILTVNDLGVIRGGLLFQLGLSNIEWKVLIGAIFILLVVDLVQEKSGQRVECFIYQLPLLFRWMIVISLILIVLVFGEYSLGVQATPFIYFQF